MKKRLSLLVIMLLSMAASNICAQGPNGSGTYYQAADGKSGAALKTALCGVIYDRNEGGDLNTAYKALWTHFQTTDKRPDGTVWDMYSNKRSMTFGTDQAGNYQKEGDVYNREHSFPNSWFGGKVMPMYTDLHHLYPSDGYVNNKRANYPFGETNGESYKSAHNFSKLGKCTYSGYSGTVFEPNDEYKGDFARTYFYMVTCYEEKLADWYANNAESRPTITATAYPGLSEWQLEMLMKWAAADPVSEKETARNDAVYAIQENRNPFIDYPGLERFIWGDLKDTPFSYDNYSTDVPVVDPHTVENITFADANVKALCVANWDTNGDGELSVDEAATVTDLGTIFSNNATITSFDELQYFTSLTSIGQYAFRGCSGLTTITIPSTVTSIEYCAFLQCGGLTTITIPSTVTSIGEWAFYNCKKLKTVYSEIVSPFAINENVFSDKTYAGTLYVPNGTRARYRQTDGWKNFTNMVDPEPTTFTLTITTIGNGSVSYDETTLRNTTSSITVEEGTSATITFTPDNGYQIQSVTVNESVVNLTNNQFTISSISANTTVSVEFALTDPGVSINGTMIDNNKVAARYTLEGQRTKRQPKGLTIVRMDDGTMKKIIVK